MTELRAAVASVLNAAESPRPTVAFERDFYWQLPVDGAFDMTTEPRDLPVGQLGVDLAEFRAR